MCEPKLPNEVVRLNSDIESIFASSISKSAKTAAIKSLVKTAKLSEESRKAFVKYWNDTLGYQDKDFWPLVAADYDNGKKVN